MSCKVFWTALITTFVYNLPPLPITSALTWRGFSTSCYTTLTTDDCVGLTQCSDMCRQLGSNLVEIDTPEELTFLQNFLSEGDRIPYWVGVEYNGTDSHNGVHRWINSKEVVDTDFWHVGEPDHFVNSCVRLGFIPEAGDLYKLNVRNNASGQCDTVTYGTVCEARARSQEVSASFSFDSHKSCQGAGSMWRVRSRAECAAKCAKLEGCVGFFFNRSGYTCAVYQPPVYTNCSASSEEYFRNNADLCSFS